MTFTIRMATEQDATAWADLRHALWPHEARDELAVEIPSMAARTDSLSLIAWNGETAIGLLEVEIRPHAPGSDGQPIPYLEGWYVAEGWRRKGVGAALVQEAEAWARRNGYAAMASDTILAYPDSPAAHAALGYQVFAMSEDPEDGLTWHFLKRLEP